MADLLLPSFFFTKNILFKGCVPSWDLIHTFSISTLFKRFSISYDTTSLIEIQFPLKFLLISLANKGNSITLYDRQPLKTCKSVLVFLLFVQLEADLGKTIFTSAWAYGKSFLGIYDGISFKKVARVTFLFVLASVIPFVTITVVEPLLRLLLEW